MGHQITTNLVLPLYCKPRSYDIYQMSLIIDQSNIISHKRCFHKCLSVILRDPHVTITLDTLDIGPRSTIKQIYIYKMGTFPIISTSSIDLWQEISKCVHVKHSTEIYSCLICLCI